VKTDEGEKGEYKMYFSEGIDDDNDDKINEDPPGGTDVYRNWPAGWELAYMQSNSGKYPISEPESRAIMEFLVNHRNVAAMVSFHTTTGQLVRPFAYKVDKNNIPERDLKLFDKLGKKFEELTGYYYAKGYDGKGSKTYGVFSDWGYEHFGVLAFTLDLWGTPFYYNLEDKKKMGDGSLRALNALKWNDEVLNGDGFVDWHPYEHPTLGEIEIGGWKKYTRKNPPARLLNGELEKNFPFIFALAEFTPLVKVTNVEIKPMVSGVSGSPLKVEKTGLGYVLKSKDSGNAGDISLFQFEMVVENKSIVDTYTAQAEKTEEGKDVQIFLKQKDGISILQGEPLTNLEKMKPQESKTIRWVLQAKGTDSVINVRVFSEKGGTTELKIPVRVEY